MELFFKFIKQNLKSLVGTSRNAVTTQLWIAMCMYLLVSHVKFLSRQGWRLVEILRLLQLNLFERRSLDGLLLNKTQDPPAPAPQIELKFAWS